MTPRNSIDEILFLDDFLRSAENGLMSGPHNRKFLKGLFGTAASRLGWTIRDESSQSLGGRIPVRKVMGRLGLSLDLHGWASATNGDLGGGGLDSLLGIQPTTLVIGWGMPPSLLRYIDARGAAFIDIELHWVRFCANLHLTARTNTCRIQQFFESVRIDEEHFWAGAAGLRAHFARTGIPSFLSSDTRIGVFAGQMAVDLALVCDGRVILPEEHVDRIRDWAREVDVLAICPHPAEPDQERLRALADVIPNAVITGVNSYRLLCAENVAFVASLSSGILEEARYLGCRDIRRLIREDRNNAEKLPDRCSPWVPVPLEIASIHALRAFAGTADAKHCGEATQSRLFPPNLIETSFGYRWGLNLEAPSLPEIVAVKPDETILVGAGSPGNAAVSCIHGWHASEGWGVWTSWSRTHVLIRLDLDGGTSELELFLSGRAFAPDGFPPPEIHLSINGRPLELYSSVEYEMVWRGQLDRETMDAPVLIVAIKVPNPWGSRDMGGDPNDRRQFGLGLREISLRPLAGSGKILPPDGIP